MSKIDINNFTRSELIAKLYVMQKDFLLTTKEEAEQYALTKVKEHFVYEESKEELISAHLLLFLLGSNNNVFSKTIQ